MPSSRDHVVERDDDPGERKRQPEQEQDEQGPRARDAQVADGEAGHRGEDDGDGHDPEHDEDARGEQRAHVRVLEGLEEVAPLRVVGPREPSGTVREGCRAVVNRLTNGTIVTTMSTMSSSRPVQASVRPTITLDSSRVSRWMGSDRDEDEDDEDDREG